MKFTPHTYQKTAIDFILSHPVAAVFLSMGLGKTVITLTALYDLLLNSFQVSRVLIIAPLRVARDTWPQEITKWDHLKGLTYAVAVGSTAERMQALKADAQITIINRENVSWLCTVSVWRWDMVVIDELSSFKSHNSKRFRSLLLKRPLVKRIIGLTGTPAPNGLMDLWAEFRLLDLGERLGQFITRYRTAFFRPDSFNGPIVYSYTPLPGAEEHIYGRLADISISMSAVGNLQMPELIENVYPVCMSPAESTVYQELKHDLTALGGEITASSAGVLAGKLSQLANGAIYTDDGKTVILHDRKLDALEDIIEAMLGKPLLVAYWFRHDFDRIKARFPAARELKSSQDFIDWNAGRIPVALIHPASAGHGLNLQSGGSTLVWFGLTWSLELYQQTCARLWRQGQPAATVQIVRLVTVDTIDERILQALQAKDFTQSRLLEAVKACL